MKYSIILSDDALKQLRKLNREIQLRIRGSLRRIEIRPFSHIKKLKNSPYYRLRVGKYRVIMRIEQDRLIILVVEIGHRERIY
ncbi:MAG: type II toxin-antitoxin system RelE/ParE family toxin [Candidatus Woesearchaeota archaeon]|jgi:mRNA interferase RelE/StbE|nr:type II toxin-antitoxin system RelE/ParE family toxin [Candidatus Woesearchaeota archaeon]